MPLTGLEKQAGEVVLVDALHHQEDLRREASALKECVAAKTVNGWRFSGPLPVPSAVANLQPLSGFSSPPGVTILDQEQAKEYFAGIAARYSQTTQREERLNASLSRYFAAGKSRNIRFYNVRGGPRKVVQFTPSAAPSITKQQDGMTAFSVRGNIVYVEGGNNQTCSQHGGPTFRAASAEVTGTLERTADEQSRYKLSYNVFDPVAGRFCGGNSSSSPQEANKFTETGAVTTELMNGYRVEFVN